MASTTRFTGDDYCDCTQREGYATSGEVEQRSSVPALYSEHCCSIQLPWIISILKAKREVLHAN